MIAKTPKHEPTREELLAENARLKEALLRRRSGSPMWPVVAGLVAHIALRQVFDSWLNSASDAKVDIAVVVVLLPIGFSLTMLFRALGAKSD